jgi:uncharacterized protein YegL
VYVHVGPSRGSSAEEALAILQKGLGGFGPPAGLAPNVFLAGGDFFSPRGNFSRSVGKRMISDKDKLVVCPSDRDIAIIVDTSGSVGNANFRLALSDLADIIPLLCGFQEKLISCGAYRLAMITYGSNVKLAFDLNDLADRHTNQINVKNDIETRPEYTGGWTATGDALKFAKDRVLQTAHGMRPYSKKTILLLTDGHYNRGLDPITVSNELFETYDELSVVALGIGNNVDYQELIDITNHNNPANALVLFTESFTAFHDTVKEIKQLLEGQQDTCSADVLAKKRK